MLLEFPEASSSDTHTLPQLIEEWSRQSAGGRCEFDHSHGDKQPAQKKIFHTPPVLIIRVERMGLQTLLASQDGQDFEDVAGFKSNPLTLEPTLDLRKWCARSLPSESTLGSLPTDSLITKYKLASVVEYLNRHYVNYSKAPDDDGNLFWACFNDIRNRVEWDDPLQDQASSPFEYQIPQSY